VQAAAGQTQGAVRDDGQHPQDRRRPLIGAAEGDDAAVLRLDNERAPVLTTDFFWHGARRQARSPRMDSGGSAG